MAGIISAILTAGGAEMEIYGGKLLEKTQTKLFNEQAEQAQKEAAAEVGIAERQMSAQMASGRAARAGSGIDFSGSVLDIDEALAEEMALNKNIILFRGDLRAAEIKRERNFNRLTGKLGRRVTAISAGQKAFSQASTDFSSGGFFGSSTSSSGSGGGGSTFNSSAAEF